jgi:hypothetical protein
MIRAIIITMRRAMVLVTVIVTVTSIFVAMGRRGVKVMTIRVLVIHILVPTMRTHVLPTIRVFVPVRIPVIFLITVIGAVGIFPKLAGPPISSRGAGIALRTRRARRTEALFTLSQVGYSSSRSTLSALRAGRGRRRRRGRGRRRRRGRGGRRWRR